MSERDIDKNPYSPDEMRVAEFFFERGLGGGDDPIGFILSSYAYLVAERNELRTASAATPAPKPAAIARILNDCFYTGEPGQHEAICTALNDILGALAAAATPVCPADPEIAALYSALIKANIPFAAYSSNGFNLIGDSKSIKEATAAFHHHAQIDEFRTQIRHWREECGKLHAKIAAQEKS